jgi:SAM-dependent methyltransferase
LADAMREGLHRRRYCAPAPAGPDFGPLTQLEPRVRVVPYADLVSHAPAARSRFAGRAVGWMRRAFRAFLRPWLDLQTRFNDGAAEVLLAHHAELLRCLNDLSGQGRRITELFHHLYQEQEARQLLADRFDRLAGGAADLPGPESAAPRQVLEHVFLHTRLPAPPAQLLELSCGPADRAVELASLGFHVTGVDLDALPPGDAPAGLPFPDESFDVVTALSGLAGAGLRGAIGPDADLRVVAEFARVLRPGGRLLLSVPYGRAAVTAAGRVYDRARLEALLRPLAQVERRFGVPRGGRWAFTADEPAGAGAALALVVAEKP